MTEQRISKDQLKEAVTRFGTELYTLDKYLQDPDMETLHGERFRSMIVAMNTALQVLKGYEVKKEYECIKCGHMVGKYHRCNDLKDKEIQSLKEKIEGYKETIDILKSEDEKVGIIASLREKLSKYEKEGI